MALIHKSWRSLIMEDFLGVFSENDRRSFSGNLEASVSALSPSAAAGGSRKLLRPRATEWRPVAAGTQPRGVELVITRAD